MFNLVFQLMFSLVLELMFSLMLQLMFSLLYLPVSLTREQGENGPVSSIPESGQWLLCLLSPVTLALAVDQVTHSR